MDLIQKEVEGKFEILHKINEGGMGIVYKARHLLLDQISVIKVIHPQAVGDEHLQQRFLNEARTASRLRHPNIAEIRDFFNDDQGNSYLVMEFIDGINFKEKLEQGALTLDETLEFSRQGLEALGFLHRQGYIHRDISPDNLMVTSNFDGKPLVKLIDLGIAKNLSSAPDLTSTGMFVGKARYSSPEQIRGSDDLDQRSDLYSFGVMLYQMATGTSPIDGTEISALVAGHLFSPPIPFEISDPDGKVPEELRALILHMLEKDREDRVASAEEVLRRLDTVPLPESVESQDTAATAALPREGSSSTAPKTSSTPGDRRDVRPGGGADRTASVTQEASAAIPDKAGGPSAARRGLQLLVVALGLILLLGVGWWALAPSGQSATTHSAESGEQQARDDFRLALQEMGRENWNEAARLLRQAAEADPTESTEPVEIAPGHSEPYLPHYFLGLALFEMNNYVLALDAWEASDGQGAITQTDKYPSLQKLRAESGSIVVDPAILEAGKAIESAGEYAQIVGDLMDDPALRNTWQAETQVAETARSLLRDFEDVSAALDAASQRRDLRAIEAADSRAQELKGKLVDLANQMLDLSEGQ